jgi:putative transposase
MSTKIEDEFKRWTAKRKAALMTEIIQGKTTISEAKRGMENALRAKPLDIKEQYERQLKELQEAYGGGDVRAACQKKAGVPAGRGRQMIESLHQGLQEEGVKVSISKLCDWFEVPRRSVYYRPTKASPKAQTRFAEPIKAMIEAEPSFGYRTVASLLGFNKNTV